MKYDYFVSSRWRNKEQVLDLVTKLRANGKTVYCFLEDKSDYEGMNEDPGKWMNTFESIPNWREDPRVKEMFQVDMEGLKEAETFILLLPAGKSCHIEAGIAYGLGKKCILIGEQKEAESLYLIFSEVYLSSNDFLKSM